MRETTKQVKHEVDGKEMTFQITKMDAFSGRYLLTFCTSKILPLLASAEELFKPAGDDEDPEEVRKRQMAALTEVIPKAVDAIDDEEMTKFQKKCLRTVQVLLPAGWRDVMTGDNFNVDELNDAIIALVLCVDVLMFNVGGFFQGKGSGLLQRIQNFSRPNA